MNTRRAFCLGVAGWAAAGSAAEPLPPVVREIRQRMADDPVLRGSFEQRKSIRGFRNPLLSRGDFVVARQRGVLWRTAEPFPSTLVVTRDRVLARNADGTIARRLQASEEPAVRAISETLFALMAADLAILAQRFQIEGESGAAGWKLALAPREAALARWLQRVELEGDRYLRSVRLAEINGDQTQIRLGRHAGAASMSAEEEAQFE
jgi:hypothetical protein